MRKTIREIQQSAERISGLCRDLAPHDAHGTSGASTPAATRKKTRSRGDAEWETPNDLFDALNKEFQFDRDVCATRANTKCGAFFTRAQNGLTRRWIGTVWLNPPFMEKEKWLAKAIREARRGTTVVALVPSATETRWFNRLALQAHEIRFLNRRIRFVRAGRPCTGVPTFASAILVYRPGSPAKRGPKFIANWAWPRRRR